MTLEQFLEGAAAIAVAAGLFGTALEKIGEAAKKPWLVAIGQRLEALSIDVPKLLRGSRFTSATVDQLAEQAAKKVDSEK